MASVLNNNEMGMGNDQIRDDSTEVTLDLVRALENCGCDEGLLVEIATVFIEDVPGLIGDLETACLRNDSAGVELVAHSLKGLCATFGAEPARTYAQGIELSAADCGSPLMRDRVQVLIGLLEQTMISLRHQLRLSV